MHEPTGNQARPPEEEMSVGIRGLGTLEARGPSAVIIALGSVAISAAIVTASILTLRYVEHERAQSSQGTIIDVTSVNKEIQNALDAIDARLDQADLDRNQEHAELQIGEDRLFCLLTLNPASRAEQIRRANGDITKLCPWLRERPQRREIQKKP